MCETKKNVTNWSGIFLKVSYITTGASAGHDTLRIESAPASNIMTTDIYLILGRDINTFLLPSEIAECHVAVDVIYNGS